MKVEELIIDGFKSYATRTVVSGWDSSFNCITGLNGSGKSNILDAICFVLGITSMSTVRAQNLQDLIYKRGQAGVTKASVTIVFDNSEKEKSPIGFEDQQKISVTRQIVMGGTSKYLINGHRAQQQSVQQLFQSVQLNINNPNFLIMQGRITKVLNMKSNEILALIEEAAGTRMFEERREKAIKTMAKKEKKVEEIMGLLQEEIEPKLETLRAEKRMFLEFQQVQSDLERTEKMVVAFDHVRYSDKLAEETKVLEDNQAHVEALEKLVQKSAAEIASLTEDISALKKRREAQIRKDGRFQALEKEVKELSQQSARINTLAELKATTIEEEQKKRNNLQSNVANLEAKIQQNDAQFKKLQENYETIKKEYEELSLEKDRKEELLQSLQTGVSSKEGHESGYANELQTVRQSIASASTTGAQAKVRLDSVQKQIKADAPKVENAKQQHASTIQALEEMQKQYDYLKSKLAEAGIVPGRLDELKTQESKLVNDVRQLARQIDDAKRTASNVDFNYSKPSPNFNPNSVKGVVAQLFSLAEDKYEAATALEVCAGGRLYQVVVDSDVTASQLLQHGKLKRRVTIIPLNKINAYKIHPQKLAAAKKLAPGKVHLALDLITYDKDVERAMEYVFGNTLICADAESAKKVAFDPSVRVKTVTLEGDIYDPMGTLSGGSNSSGSNGILVRLQKLNQLDNTHKDLSEQLKFSRQKLDAEQRLTDNSRALKKELDLKEHEIKLSQQKLESGPFASTIKSFRERSEQVSELEKLIKESSETEKKGNMEIKRIEKEMSEFNSNKSGKLKELEIEAERFSGDLTSAKELFTENETSIAELQASLSEIGKEHDEIKAREQVAVASLAEEKSKLIGLDEELSSMESALTTKTKFSAENKLRIQKVRHLVEKLEAEVNAVTHAIKKLENDNEWVEQEKELFGKPNTPYNFHGVDIAAYRDEHNRLVHRMQGIKKTVNTKVMNMIENVEKKEASLKTMIRTIEKDKKKIEETIVSLDDYKRKALVETWENVTKDFGNIFSDLLPGSTAKLVMPEGATDITEGLEVKVALGNVWKESLAELSGGQRSLVALSLILALLQFKPAPMYILDEVDAALDLSHTQNIGQLIKTRFKGAQFIVVSLKEGMFTNANRVFRTRFQEGTSTVSVM
ncbi:hypothetical protein DV451_003466 [Geotrichum candidum]|uniref:SMC hinge domain-containing protein n=1 Tax=Geotrichum candidum TaxID=1173061 RepID=A0A9P5G4S8_GEOCN|nr:hypothetical protein DV451_003466 [Geotrichum candidum]